MPVFFNVPLFQHGLNATIELVPQREVIKLTGKRFKKRTKPLPFRFTWFTFSEQTISKDACRKQ